MHATGGEGERGEIVMTGAEETVAGVPTEGVIKWEQRTDGGNVDVRSQEDKCQ